MTVNEALAQVDWDGQVLRHEGRMWKPEPGASSTAEEFLEARERFIRLHKDAAWNPWVIDDHAAELDRAEAVMEQWTRAEPGFTYTTIEDLEQRWAREDEQRAARLAEEDRQRQQRRALYDAGRETARLALLEQEAHLAIRQRERDKLQDGTSFPAMPADRRSAKIAECDAAIASIGNKVDRLRGQVGDPETVVDQLGRLPNERRELSLSMF